MMVHLHGILARHALRQVLVPFFCCFFGFLFLFFIADLQDELSDMLEHDSYVDIGLYFLYILPEKVSLILPMSLLLGTMYSFSNLNRHNEISAIRSSGISIPTLSTPLVVFSLIMAFMIFASNEYLQSFFHTESKRLHEQITGDREELDTVSFSVDNEQGKRLWSLSFEENDFKRISLSQNDLDGNPMWTVDAYSGTYSKTEGWNFKTATITKYDENWFPSAPEKHESLNLADIKDDPVLMREFHDINQHLTLKSINKRLNSNVQFSPSAVQIMSVKYYALIFTPFACMLSVLLGIPLSITQQRQGALASSAKALGIMIGYYIVVQVFQNMGNAGHIPAIVAGSFPTLGFIGLGVYIGLKKQN
ncbi:MAG: LptF/LptG family permease [Lentisphaeraceae bacterium]|nr:LptF/LptG family permease [Lentisphaeraceae bacterium]